MNAYEKNMSDETPVSTEAPIPGIQDSSIENYVIEDSSDESQEGDPPEFKVGLMEEAFAVLKNASGMDQKNWKPTLCGLLIGEIKLTQKYEKYNGKLFGYTEGIGRSPLHEPKKMASKAVIFMVISLSDNWKIPIGLFFVHNPDIKYFADTIEETLKRLQAINITIISITLNCISPHLSFALAEELGAEIDSSKHTSTFKPSFKHPSTGKMVHILYDLDIILGFLKSFWATERVICYKTKKLNYAMCVDVKKIEETDLQSYQFNTMFEWIIIRKRLSYDPESIGKTTADAMQYLKDLGHPDFQDSGPTIQFVKVLDLIAQISRVNGQEGELYTNLTKSNEPLWRPLVLNILAYVKELRSLNQDMPEHLSVFKTFTTGIIVYFTSLLDIYTKHVTVDIINKTDAYSLGALAPSRFGLKHIRVGLLEGLSDKEDLTALGLFKKIKTVTTRFHLIEAH